MYEEPYRWVEAVGNRRQYLDDQLRQGSPVVALSYAEGTVLLTFSKGTPKLYEIYDRIGLAGMGHPADLEKLRFTLLDMAHMEGFQRSPGDVTGSRLVKYGLAPVIKQAFEEIFRAPFIIKILLAELGAKPEQDHFLTVDYDGAFEETPGWAVLGATPEIQRHMMAYVKSQIPQPPPTLQVSVETALQTWAIGSLHQTQEELKPAEPNKSDPATTMQNDPAFDETKILDHLRDTLSEKTLECAVLERNAPGSSKYRPLSPEETRSLLPTVLQEVR